MKLSEILKGIEILETKGNLEVDITNLGSDSRKLYFRRIVFCN